MDDKELIIPVIEERVSIDTEVVTTGSVSVRKIVKDQLQPVSALLHSQSYDIQRVPKDQVLDQMPQAFEERPDRIVIPVVEERLVVEKRLVLVEEIHLVRKETTTEFHDHVNLKKEVVEVERKPA